MTGLENARTLPEGSITAGSNICEFLLGYLFFNRPRVDLCTLVRLPVGGRCILRQRVTLISNYPEFQDVPVRQMR